MLLCLYLKRIIFGYGPLLRLYFVSLISGFYIMNKNSEPANDVTNIIYAYDDFTENVNLIISIIYSMKLINIHSYESF